MVTTVRTIWSIRTGALASALVLCLLAPQALAVQVQDLVRIKGAESSTLNGMGLVVGLNGTGDGDRSLPTIRKLAGMMNLLGEPLVTPAELTAAKNVAVVMITATTPVGGAREGDAIDVQISAPMARSLEGGRLLPAALIGPVPGSPVYALASGPITVESEKSPNTAVVKKGGKLVQDIRAQYLNELGQITLVIESTKATWPVARTLTALVNDTMSPDGLDIARAIDQKSIVINVPPVEQANPGAFISQILQIPIDSSLLRTEARVVINEATETIVITGNVEFTPSLISHKGLTIARLNPPAVPTPENPEVLQEAFIPLAGAGGATARLQDLMTAFNQLNVAAEDRIEIIKTLERSGQLHANVILHD